MQQFFFKIRENGELSVQISPDRKYIFGERRTILEP